MRRASASPLRHACRAPGFVDDHARVLTATPRDLRESFPEQNQRLLGLRDAIANGTGRADGGAGPGTLAEVRIRFHAISH